MLTLRLADGLPSLRNLLLVALGVAHGTLSGQSPPVGTRTDPEIREIWSRRAQRALRLSPVLLSADRVFAGEKVFIHCSQLNKGVEDLVRIERPPWVNGVYRPLRTGGVATAYLEKLGGQKEIVQWELATAEAGKKSERRGGRYVLGAGTLLDSSSVTPEGDCQFAAGNTPGFVMAFGERWPMHFPWLDTTGFPIGAYEITVELTDGVRADVIDTRKARFTVLPR